MDDLRSKIIEIQKRNDITGEEKSKLIFAVMNPNHGQTMDDSEDEIEVEVEKDKCPHYIRNCSLQCPECNKFYKCRVCHDEHIDSHKLDRFNVKQIRCDLCKTIQKPAEKCISCKEPFATYCCLICNLYDSTPGKLISHCDKCGICRVGDNIHCDKCSMCFSRATFDSHPCVASQNYDNYCPICHEDLRTSRTAVSTMPCGHTIHNECLQKNLMNGNYQCPLCKKTVGDMTPLWQQIEQYISESEMPEEYRDMKSEVICNDCEVKTITKFHFMYHKCGRCNGWNTNIVRTFKDTNTNNSDNNDNGDNNNTFINSINVVLSELNSELNSTLTSESSSDLDLDIDLNIDSDVE